MSLADLRLEWPTAPMKRIASLNPETLTNNVDSDYRFEYVDIGSVERGRIVNSSTVSFGEAPSRARRVIRTDDVLVASVRPHLRAIASVPRHLDGQVASTGFTVLRPHQDMIDAGFLRYWCLSESFISELVRRSKGVSYPAVDREDVAELPVPVPALRVQRAIADYLDRETQRLDALTARYADLEGLVWERWEALLEHEVQQVGDGTTAPLWALVRRGRPIIYGIVLPGPNVDDGVPLVKGGDVHSHQLDAGVASRVAYDVEEPKARSRVAAGDLVYAIRGSFGDVEIVPPQLDGANITQDVARISPDPARVRARWLYYMLQAPSVRDQARRVSLGATISGVNIEDLRRFRVPLLTLGDQDRQLRRLDDAAETTWRLLARCQEQRRLLAERRQALITAAVSGELEVGKAA